MMSTPEQELAAIRRWHSHHGGSDVRDCDTCKVDEILSADARRWIQLASEAAQARDVAETELRQERATLEAVMSALDGNEPEVSIADARIVMAADFAEERRAWRAGARAALMDALHDHAKTWGLLREAADEAEAASGLRGGRVDLKERARSWVDHQGWGTGPAYDWIYEWMAEFAAEMAQDEAVVREVHSKWDPCPGAAAAYEAAEVEIEKLQKELEEATPALLLSERQLEQARQENERLRTKLDEDNAACLCGCPEDVHEADDCGESCADETHECLRVAPAVLRVVEGLRAENERLKGEVKATRNVLETYVSGSCYEHPECALHDVAHRLGLKLDAAEREIGAQLGLADEVKLACRNADEEAAAEVERLRSRLERAEKVVSAAKAKCQPDMCGCLREALREFDATGDITQCAGEMTDIALAAWDREGISPEERERRIAAAERSLGIAEEEAHDDAE